MRHIDFENIEKKFDAATDTPAYKQLIKDFHKSDDIYIVANGGLWAVGNHAADDCTRLFAKAGIKKSVNALESQCLMTSIANDYGWNNLFLSWLELQKKCGKMSKNAMIIGLSCSGGSKNVTSCCHWAEKNGFKTAMISGQDRGILGDSINQLVLDCKYFHTVEVLSLILFYDLIHACGAKCPTIKDEVVRKNISQPLSRNPINE
jgi:phosphoheptose isomerase